MYLAEDVKLGRKVALKVPQPSVVAQPENLARFGARHRRLQACDTTTSVPSTT